MAYSYVGIVADCWWRVLRRHRRLGAPGRLPYARNPATAEVGAIMQSDKAVRRAVCSHARDPLYLDTRVAMSGTPPQPVATRAEAAVMRALGGDHAWASFTLRALENETASYDRPIDQLRKRVVSDLTVSLAKRGCVRDILDPMAVAGRNRLTIEHVRRASITTAPLQAQAARLPW